MWNRDGEAGEQLNGAASQALRQSEARYRELFNHIHDGVSVFLAVNDGEDFVLKDINKAGERINRVSRAEVIGRRFTELRPAAERYGLLQAFRRVWKTGEAESHPPVYYEDERVAGWYERYIYKLPTGELVNVVEDVTEAKRAEDDLKESRGVFHAFMEQLPAFAYIKDHELRMQFVNQATKERFGAEDWIGKRPEEYRHHTAVEHTVADDERALREGPIQVQREVEEADGRTRHYQVFKFPIHRDGKPPQLGGITIDITGMVQAQEESRRLEAQVLHAQKLESLGVLAGGIAHDFNNLLMSILGNVDLATDELSSLSPARNNIKEIETAAKRAAELCHQMLAYSGKGRFVVQPIDLNELVHEMTHLLEVSVSKKAVLKYNVGANLPAIEADATQMRQIIMNLITNASDAIGERSGVISISTGAMDCDEAYLNGTYVNEDLPPGCYVYFEVADTGCGMDAETRKKIFDPFFTTKFTGRGLGMAAVLGIVRGHRGAIKVYSEVGKGSTFKVLFPAQDSPAEPLRREGEGKTTWRGSGLILLVDDEETVRAVGKRMLERLGFSVVTAEHGQQALDFFKERPDEVDCVLLDLTMPHMDGEETFRELRRVRQDVRVVLSSGYNEQDVTQRFVGKGLAGFIQKPYQLTTLERTLQTVLG